MNEEFFICSCNNVEHMVIFWRDIDLLGIDIHLVPESNIFKRIWNGIKYIFGYRSRCFDNFIFKDEDRKKLLNVLQNELGV